MAELNRSLSEDPKSTNAVARRYSTGKPTEKAVPIYLRASTGSCHDFCKYGRKNEFEEKARPPFLRRKAKKPPDVETSSDSNSLSNSNPKEKPKFPEIIKGQVSPVSLNRRTVASNSKVLLTKSVDRQIPEALANKKTAKVVALTESSKNRTDRKNSLPPSRILTKSFESKSSISGEFERRNKESAVKLRTSKTRLSQDMALPSGKLKASLKQDSTKVVEDNVLAKRASSSKPRLSLPNSSSISSGNRNSNLLTGQKTKIAPKALVSPKSSSRVIVKGQSNPKPSLSLKPTLKVQLSSKALLSPKTSNTEIARKTASPRVPSLNRRNHKGLEVQSQELKHSSSDSVQEKTLYIIETETENKILESNHNENLSAELSSSPPVSAKSPPLPESSISNEEEESEYTMDTEEDSVSEYDETEAHPLEMRDRKARPVHLEDNKESQPFKVRFRQGRVIEMEPEHNTPRRLKFRKGRSIGENQNSRSDGRKSFKRRGSDGNGNDSNPNSEKVVLRHQEDAHGKKDGQGLLFNNVIEETASKLVETRKSKVKALVGAFETVISLQDGKPTAN